MITFYFGAAVLLLCAFFFLCWPLIGRYLSRSTNAAESDTRTSTNIALYQDHLADLDQSLTTGMVDQAEYDQLKIELERNLLEDSQSSVADNAVMSAGAKSRWLIAGTAALLLVSAAAIYYELGAYASWQVRTALEHRAELEQQYAVTRDQRLEAQMVAANYEVLKQLESHLEKTPDNLQMRALFARTSMSLGLYEQAIAGFRAILLKEPTLSQIMAELAQALFLQNDNRVGTEVQALVVNVLQVEPKNTMALGLAGIAAFQVEHYQKAIEFWSRAVEIQGANSPSSTAFMGGIQTARQRLGQKASLAQSASDGPESGSELDSSASNTGSEASVSGRSVMLNVSLEGNVTFSPEDTVFIYARAWQGAKIPLAITRIQASQLPITVTLTDAMSMAPEINLSSADQLELVARLSSSGRPVPQSGDWQVSLGPVDALDSEGSPYELVIAEQLP